MNGHLCGMRGQSSGCHGDASLLTSLLDEAAWFSDDRNAYVIELFRR